MAGTSKIEVLITVKAYPNPSAAIGEAACIAGISRAGKWVRLYPVPFRDLDDGQAFQKYQWIEVNVAKPHQDSRPETLRPLSPSIKTIGEALSTRDGWAARRSVVMPLRSRSMCDIQDAQANTGASLGVFRPAQILDLEAEAEDPREWTAAERQKLSQGDLFVTKEKAVLEKIPIGFYYRYRCDACRTVEPHRMKIIDWELAQLWRKVRPGCTEPEAIEQVREKFLGKLCAPDVDTHFFTGNMQRYPKNFLVLGVFWPKRIPQTSLFEPT